MLKNNYINNYEEPDITTKESTLMHNYKGQAKTHISNHQSQLSGSKYEIK